MSVNLAEWLEAQGLLLKLVEVLAPFTERTVSHSFFLSKRFVLPKIDQENPPLQDRRLVQLLTQLRSEVDEWIYDARQVKLSHLIEEDPTKEVPIAKHAQRLLGQVREAIGKLCTSDQIQSRQEAPLRQTLLAIKPGLDRMIQVAEEQELPLKEAQTRPFYRFALPPPARGHLFPLKEPAETKRGGGELDPELSIESGESEGEAPFKPSEKTSLPAAPFTPNMQKLEPPRKKKKKSSKAWSEEEEEEPKA